MALAEIPDLYKVVPLYTEKGQHYGYTLEKWNKEGVLFFKEPAHGVEEAVNLMKELDMRNDTFFEETLAEALDPNK